VRFELCAQALDATITTIAPWREPEFLERFKGRTDLLDYAAAHNIQVTRVTSPETRRLALLGATLVKLSSKPSS
jgi:argininosuccinate synthase